MVAEPCPFERLDSLVEKLAFLAEDDLVRCSVKVLEGKFCCVLIVNVGQRAFEDLPARLEFIGIFVDNGLRQLEWLLQPQDGHHGAGCGRPHTSCVYGRHTLRIGRTLFGREAIAVMWVRRQPLERYGDDSSWW